MHNNEYQIDKGIPIPMEGHRGKWSQLAAQMNEGDSVIVKGRLEAMNLRNAITKLGFRCVTRGNDKLETRVWKIKKQ